MKILAIECSAGPVSVTVTDYGEIKASAFSSIKVTHSETLIPLVNSVLKSARMNIGEIDCFAVANGPGSFTGVRIGIAAVKGMAAPDNKPCCGVSTLLAMAMRFTSTDALICPVMDARRNQLYNALFEAKNGKIARICDDRAVSCEELKKELLSFDGKIIICGDGAHVFAPYTKNIPGAVLAGGELALQNATGVAAAAYDAARAGNLCAPAELLPVYLRLPQAERELKLKLKKE